MRKCICLVANNKKEEWNAEYLFPEFAEQLIDGKIYSVNEIIAMNPQLKASGFVDKQYKCVIEYL